MTVPHALARIFLCTFGKHGKGLAVSAWSDQKEVTIQCQRCSVTLVYQWDEKPEWSPP